MASPESYILVGSTRKPYGTEGEMKLKIAPEYIEDVLQAQVLFLSVQGKPLPYFVENMRALDQLTVRLEDVGSKEAAHKLSSKEIYLREKDLIPDAQRQFEVDDGLVFSALTGFTLMEETVGELGKIEEVVEYPQQEMAVVTYQEKEILIPLNEQFILSIDEKQQQVRVQLPEGLLDL